MKTEVQAAVALYMLAKSLDPNELFITHEILHEYSGLPPYGYRAAAQSFLCTPVEAEHTTTNQMSLRILVIRSLS